MDLGLTGHGVLVTGGAGGIGSAIVRRLAGEGARVAVHYRSGREAAEALAAEVGGIAVGADLADEAEVDALVPAAVASLGRLDACIANAGIWPAEDVGVVDMDLTRWRRTIDVDLTGVFLTVRSFLRHVRTTAEGALVLVASTAGHVGEAGHADYAAAKAGLVGGLLPSLKNEVTRLGAGVRVNAVSPGWVATPMTAGSLTAEVLARATATMALRKVATPEDVAAAVAFLASPVAAGHVSGQVVRVDGGMEGRLLHDPDETTT